MRATPASPAPRPPAGAIEPPSPVRPVDAPRPEKDVSGAEVDARALMALLASPLFQRMLAIMLAPASVVAGVLILLRLLGVL